MFGDFDVMYQAGQALLRGEYAAAALYPLPAVCLFALLALLPRDAALALVLITSAAVLIALFKWRAALWVLYAPVLQVFAFGQIDLLCLGLLRLGTPLALALLSLKPQLFPLALPVLLNNRSLWKRTALYIALLYGLPTLIAPGWVGQWMRQVDDGRLRNLNGSSLWAVPLIGFAALLVMALWQRLPIEAIGTSFNPALRAYDYALLAGRDLLLIPVSWIALGLMVFLSAAWPMALCGLVLVRGDTWLNRSLVGVWRWGAMNASAKSRGLAIRLRPIGE